MGYCKMNSCYASPRCFKYCKEHRCGKWFCRKQKEDGMKTCLRHHTCRKRAHSKGYYCDLHACDKCNSRPESGKTLCTGCIIHETNRHKSK